LKKQSKNYNIEVSSMKKEAEGGEVEEVEKGREPKGYAKIGPIDSGAQFGQGVGFGWSHPRFRHHNKRDIY